MRPIARPLPKRYGASRSASAAEGTRRRKTSSAPFFGPDVRATHHTLLSSASTAPIRGGSSVTPAPASTAGADPSTVAGRSAVEGLHQTRVAGRARRERRLRRIRRPRAASGSTNRRPSRLGGAVAGDCESSGAQRARARQSAANVVRYITIGPRLEARLPLPKSKDGRLRCPVRQRGRDLLSSETGATRARSCPRSRAAARPARVGRRRAARPR